MINGQWFMGNGQLIKKAIVAIILIDILVSYTFIITHPPLVLAQQMNSDNFQIQGGNYSMTSGNKASGNFRLSDIVGQTAAAIFVSQGYVVKAGFLNKAAGEELALSISPSSVDFGTIVPHVPTHKSIQITISNGNTPGYQVLVSENQPLKTLAGATIANTRCDGQPTPCTQTQPAPWVRNISYGFGYRLDGNTVLQLFDDKSVYAPLPTTVRNDQPVILMESGLQKSNDQAIMTLKVNVGPNQPVGQYRNVIRFIALAKI